MAVDVIRTVRDDVADALRQVDEAIRYVQQMRDHLSLLNAAGDLAPEGQAGVLQAARRCGNITAAVLEQANAHTRDAHCATLRTIR